MTTLVSLLFITMVPFDSKLLIFPCTCAYRFKRLNDYQNSILVHVQLLICGKFVSQYTLYSLTFNPLHSIVEQHEKHLYNQSSHDRKYGMFRLRHALQLPIKIMGVPLQSWCITMLHFQLLQTLWVTFQATNSVRSTPAM